MIYENFKNIKDLGIREFIKREKVIWKCTGCEQYVCMHREKCLFCGAINHMYIGKDNNLTTASTLQILCHGSCEKISQEPRQTFASLRPDLKVKQMFDGRAYARKIRIIFVLYNAIYIYLNA
jgi:hypothetical protein